MVLLRHVQIPHYRGTGRQRRRRFNALAQVLGRSAIAYIRKYVIATAKCVGADLVKFAATGFEEVLSGGKDQKTSEKSVGRPSLKNNLVSGCKQRSFIARITIKEASRSREIFLPTFLAEQVGKISVPTFCGSFWKPWREGLPSWQCLYVPGTRILSYYLTRWNLHRFWTSSGSEQLRCLNESYLVLKLKFVKIPVVTKPTIAKKLKTRTNKMAKELEEGAIRVLRMRKWRLQFLSSASRAPLSIHVNKILTLFSPVLSCTSTISIFTNRIDPMRTNLTFPTTSSEPSLSTRRFCFLRDTTMKKFLTKSWNRFSLNLISQGEWKRLADPMASCCTLNCGLTSSPPLTCYVQIRKLGHVQSATDRSLTWLVTTTTLVLDLLIFCSILVVLLSKMIVTKKRADTVVYTFFE